MEDGSHKTEIPAASGSDCPVLSCLVSGGDANTQTPEFKSFLVNVEKV